MGHQHNIVWSCIPCTIIRDRADCFELKRFARISVPRGASWRKLRDRFADGYWWRSATDCFKFMKTAQIWLDQKSKYAKCATRNTNLDREYMIDYIVPHVRNAANSRGVVKCNDYITAVDTIEPSDNIQSHFITGYLRNRCKRYASSEDFDIFVLQNHDYIPTHHDVQITTIPTDRRTTQCRSGTLRQHPKQTCFHRSYSLRLAPPINIAAMVQSEFDY